MRVFAASSLLALLLAALGATGSDIETRFIKKGHFVEIRAPTFPDIASECYLFTPLNSEIDILDEKSLSDKYQYLNNTFSSCGVKINNLNKNDEGLWSLRAVLQPGHGPAYESQEQINILILGSDTSESVGSEESSKQSAEDTVASEESSKQSSEDTVASEESSKQSAEDTVASEESSKQSAEDTVASEESSKQSSEDTVASEESSKQSAEDTVASEESPKQSAEDTVASEESSKQSSEDTVASEESSKQSAEDTVAPEESPKQSAEDTVASEESSKQSSEDTVASEESSKQSPEDTVASEESSKQSPEDTVASEESSKQSSEDTVASEESSKQSAEDTVAPEESPKQSAEDTVASEESSKQSSEDTVASEESSKQSPEDTVASEESSKQSPEDTVASEESSKQSTEDTASSEESAKKSAEDTVVSEESSKQSEEDTVASEEIPELDNSVSAERPATSLETESLEASSSKEQGVEIQWLSDLEFKTRTELNVDMNLPRTLNTEKCTLTKPDGTTVDINSNIPGVKAHSASDYVSCRVVVGPMEESLLGKWTLCGSYEENDVEHRRCQNAEIVWRSPSNPGSIWHTTINPKFDHVVHFGGTLSPAVQSSGSVVSCYVVTPNEEVLSVTRDREYPNIRLVQDTVSTCSIAIGPIAESHLGDWTVYGTFDSSLWGYNEVRQPINMELYDKNDPYTQAYNVTTLDPAQHVVNLGSTIPVEVTSTGAVDVCQFTTPSGQTYLSTGTMPTGVSFVNSNRVACQLSVGPITEDLLGDWQLVGKFSHRNVYTENRLTFTIIQEDPSNPIEEDRAVQYLDENFYDTAIGASHRVVIASDFISTFQSCHIRTPEGLQYTIMEGFHIPGVEVETGSNVFCGVTLQVSEDLIGNWTLISREIRSSQAIERRRPFVIYVEETVEAVPNEITITEGNSMHVRLANPTDLNDTCKLHDPNDQETGWRQDDNQEYCGFVVSSVDVLHSGTWNIVYGTKIIYKAPVRVNVNVRGQAPVQRLTWVEHASVSQFVGPEEAVYCRVLSPMNNVVFDGFGRCHVALDRVIMDQHKARWTLEVGLPGRIVTEKYQLNVQVIAADQKPEVLATVSTNKSTELTCSVTSPRQLTGCLFRNPGGESLVASQGVSEDRYVFHVSQTSLDTDMYYYSCSLQITEPARSDMGLWRCDLQSEDEIYYGFLTVLGSWTNQDGTVATLVGAEPVLTAAVTSVSVEEGHPATLACSARTPLRYCYFRAPNGTIFNLQPGMSAPGMEYLGAGLDAGECGVRINSVMSSDNGTWSCHAGINGSEQSYHIAVFAEEQFRLWTSRQRQSIEGEVAGMRPVEYCRFVRADGLGFTSDNTPYPYIDESVLSLGYCGINNLSILDSQPWTVVTKIQGRDGEISRVIQFSWSTPVYYNAFYMWLPLLVIMTGCLLMAVAFAPTNNRRWAAARASSMRDSMRASMRRFPSLRKKPLTDTNPAA